MSPLNKRLPRDLRHNLGKYLGIFLLFLFAIAMGSGFLSAAHSIQVIQDGLHEKAHVEDFHFATQFEAAATSIKAVEEMGFKTETFTYVTEPEQSPGDGKPEYIDLLGDLVDPKAITDTHPEGERKMFWKKFVERINQEMPLMGVIDYNMTEDDDNEWD
jgi:hypothetical protein